MHKKYREHILTLVSIVILWISFSMLRKYYHTKVINTNAAYKVMAAYDNALLLNDTIRNTTYYVQLDTKTDTIRSKTMQLPTAYELYLNDTISVTPIIEARQIIEIKTKQKQK